MHYMQTRSEQYPSGCLPPHRPELAAFLPQHLSVAVEMLEAAVNGSSMDLLDLLLFPTALEGHDESSTAGKWK